MTEGLPDDADALYGLDPREFTAARNDLVRRLRAEKRRDDATAVAALKRPSPAAWALNQLARRSPEVIEAALDAVDALQAATDAAVAGEPGDLRAATAAERAATNALVDAARGHLGGRTEALRQALVSTVRSAGADPAVEAELRAGTLSSEHDPAGFGFGSALGGFDAAAAALPAVTPKGSKTAKTAVKHASGPDDAAAARQAAAAEQAAAKARAEVAKEAERLARAATRLEQAAEQAERTAQVADDGATLAEEAARDARVEAVEAKERATDARADAERARAAAVEAASALGP